MRALYATIGMVDGSIHEHDHNTRVAHEKRPFGYLTCPRLLAERSCQNPKILNFPAFFAMGKCNNRL
ncbi:hypothetical protein [Aromatoleum evansii]|uniref:hypothetical protein n=1 Tax=Aromatoleum evansii TaxID=59406 RepID=UPI00145C4FF0|nr:hypothetical protein [Aromatoleum evansii]NMG32500.1 hypothetical protein [Aromatoleum evansii]